MTCLLVGFDPSATALLDLLRARVDDDMLREIAEADYGYLTDQHLAALRSIRDGGRVPVPLVWEPREVLSLVHWSEPEDPEWKPGSMGERGHRMRAFACAALLRTGAEAEEDQRRMGENTAIVQAIASSLVLGTEAQIALLRFSLWRLEYRAEPGRQAFDDGERPFFAFGVLLLAVFLGSKRVPEAELGQLADWVLEEEAAERDIPDGYLALHGPQWLLGLTCYNQKHSTWRSLAERMVRETRAVQAVEVREKLQGIGDRIAGRRAA